MGNSTGNVQWVQNLDFANDICMLGQNCKIWKINWNNYVKKVIVVDLQLNTEETEIIA